MQAKRTTRLKNNRYRVLTSSGELEEVFADNREEARTLAERAGLAVRKVIHVQSFRTVASRLAFCLAVALAPASAGAECVEDNANQSGPPYPTGCFVKPTPAKEIITGCLIYANHSLDPLKNKCLKWKPGYGPEVNKIAPEDCSENEFNTKNGLYPTGCFVKELPVDPEAENIVPGEASDYETSEDLYIPRGENQVLMQEMDVFHPNGQLYKDHYVAAAYCLKEIRAAEQGYLYYLLHYGQYHGATLEFLSRLVGLIEGCQDPGNK